MKFKIVPIAGDASLRTFYRISSKRKSTILVFTQKEKYKNLIAYSAINKFLRQKKILAPATYLFNFSKGIMIIEDFGNLSFNKVISNNKNKLKVYKKLIDLLIKIQKINPKTRIKKIGKGFYKIDKYSNKYLFKESNLFFDWYLPLFLTKKKALKIKKESNKILLKLYNKLHFSNSCFVHRDYHAQNFMKIGKKIGILDSQDALIGNPAYDLASLIDDVRIKTSVKLKDQIYNYYFKKTLKIYKKNPEKFLEDFKILSVQRSLKIIGIFSRLLIREKKKKYVKFIPYAWKLLEMRLDLKIFEELKKILKKNIPTNIRKKLI